MTQKVTSYQIVPHAVLSEGETYYWRARFYDSYGFSAWSSTLRIKTIFTGRDANGLVVGVPDSQEVDATVDVDEDGTPDVLESDIIKSVNTEVGNVQAGLNIKNSPNVDSIDSFESVDPDTISDTTNRPANLPFGIFNIRLTMSNPGDSTTLTRVHE